jgi:hypothetical protein
VTVTAPRTPPSVVQRNGDTPAAATLDGGRLRDAGGAATLVEHEIRHIRIGAALRWATALAATTLAAWWLALGVFWASADAFGFTSRIEALASDVGFEGFRMSSGPVFIALGLLGVAWMVAVVLVAVFAAAAYNAYARLLGGIRVVAAETRVPASTQLS